MWETTQLKKYKPSYLSSHLLVLLIISSSVEINQDSRYIFAWILNNSLLVLIFGRRNNRCWLNWWIAFEGHMFMIALVCVGAACRVQGCRGGRRMCSWQVDRWGMGWLPRGPIATLSKIRQADPDFILHVPTNKSDLYLYREVIRIQTETPLQLFNQGQILYEKISCYSSSLSLFAFYQFWWFRNL